MLSYVDIQDEKKYLVTFYVFLLCQDLDPGKTFNLCIYAGKRSKIMHGTDIRSMNYKRFSGLKFVLLTQGTQLLCPEPACVAHKQLQSRRSDALLWLLKAPNSHIHAHTHTHVHTFMHSETHQYKSYYNYFKKEVHVCSWQIFVQYL